MGVDHLGEVGLKQEIQRLWSAVRKVSRATLQNGSIGRAGIRVYDGGWIRIEDGGLSVTGTQSVTGTLTGSGTFNWTGPMNLQGAQSITGPTTFTGQMTVNGPWGLNGNGAIAGTVTISGATILNSTLTVNSGQIKAGAVTITPSGGGSVKVGTLTIDGDNGGTIHGDGPIYMQGSGASSVRVVGQLTASDVNVFGTVTTWGLEAGPGPKNFRIEHPTKPGYWLRHGSTESPVSGTEYTGRATIGDDGSVVVALPDYFEALNKPRNRTVHVTPVGRPFAVGADEVQGGSFVAYGEPGRDVFWVVKAERISGDFPVEAEKEPPADQ